MKKFFTVLLTAVSIAVGYAQPATIDPTFVTGTGFNNYVFKSAIQSDGKIIISGGFSNYNGTARNCIARLNADGTIDTSFDPGTGFNNWVLDFKIQPDGKIIAVGSFSSFNGTSRNGIARLNSDGTLDTSFDPGTGFNSILRGIDLQSDGKPVLVGEFTMFNGTGRNRIARLNTNGSLDVAYNPGTGFNGNTYAVAIQGDGKAVIGGSTFTNYNGTSATRIIRLNADATVDGSFSTGTGVNSGIIDICIQPDSKILIGGGFTTYNGTTSNRMARINTDGTIDGTFDINTGFNSDVRMIELQSDGSILAVGLFTTFDGTMANRLMKLYPDGSADSNFNTGTGFNNEVNTISVDANNKLIIGGYYTSYNGTGTVRITRLNNCINTSSVDYQTACGTYLWIDGNTYSSDNNTATFTLPNAGGCDSTITLSLVILNVADETFTPDVTTLCDNGTVDITSTGSQADVRYYLRDNSDNSIVDGPIAGTGSGLTLSTGTISTTTTYNVYAEQVDNGLHFDGANDQVQATGVNLNGVSFTIETWARRNSLGTNDYLFGQGITGTNQGLHIGFRSNNEFAFAFWVDDLNTAPVYTDFDWHHWAMTYDAVTNERKIYRDGIVVASNTAANDYIGTGNLYLGNTPWGGDNLDGNMDEVRIWGVVRSQSEIEDNMNNCLSGAETNLLAYYDLDGQSGMTEVSDETGNGYDGALVNMNANTVWETGVIGCQCTAEMSSLITVTVNYSNTGTDVQEHCEQYTWIDGNTYTNDNNTATYTLTNISGCDSVVTLDLTINTPDATTDTQATCDSYLWIDGNTYTTDNNTATHTLTNSNGCDSVVTLNLNITTTPVATAINNGDGTMSATGSGTYQWIDCGTIAAVAGATSESFTPVANGSYAVVVTNGTCDDTSACVAYNSVGLNENNSVSFTLYPNPTNGMITLDFGKSIEQANIIITNVLGEQVYTETISGYTTHELNLEGPAGIYFVNIYAEGTSVSTLKVIKK